MKTRPALRAAAALSAFLLASLVSGCASYDVKVDAFQRPGPVNEKLTSFKIQNHNPGVEPDSLRYEELAEHLKTALSGHGLWEAPSTGEADMIVEVDYGLESHVVFDEVDVPVFEPEGTAAARETAANSAAANPQPQLPPGYAGKELAGLETAGLPVVVHEKHLSVSCRENKAAAEGRAPVELWRVSVSIENEDKDLRTYLPILASAAMQQIGRTTDGLVTETMSKHDDAIDFVKKGM